MKNYVFWFVVGSHLLYGDECLGQVGMDAVKIEEHLTANLPYPVEFYDVMKSNSEISEIISKANRADDCAGIITFCHTFSPSKMWINGLANLQKPWLAFHTQFNEDIPNEAIDMDYMNLHQSAHGDREHGFIGARMRIPRKVIAGYWKDPEVIERIADWQRVSVGAAFSKSLKVMRFGDNMREVAVTEGDKIEAQIKLGWQVNTWGVGAMVETMETVTENEVDEKINEYKEKYDFSLIASDADIKTVRYQAREEIAIKRLLDKEGCVAFSNTFQDLYGLKQLPGLASQNLLASGYGYAGEGDWKTSALCAIMKRMGKTVKNYSDGLSVFMEDYNYDLKNGICLGAHMLEVDPTIAQDKPRVEIHPLGIGDREAPARLVFENKPGKGIVSTIVDMGGRFRLIVQEIECVKPTQTMPNLPVARVMWKPEPSLTVGAECWIIAGGAHHTVLSLDVTADMMRDFARIMDIEFILIDKDSTPAKIEKELLINDLVWKLKG
ncbi:MAG: L-arabinose isomerase [Ruminococcus sp.]|jgi:L-arabinose isomerase|nr:L-arabinose isomerase [Ruminococcus sp.]